MYLQSHEMEAKLWRYRAELKVKQTGLPHDDKTRRRTVQRLKDNALLLRELRNARHS